MRSTRALTDMLYVIVGNDAPGALEIRRRVRARHLERIGTLAEAGRVALAGPCPAVDSPDPGDAGFSGSLIVADFDSLQAAREWISGDPYVTEGVFASYDVRPFVQVLP
jgi:uncharacterized protein YciI